MIDHGNDWLKAFSLCSLPAVISVILGLMEPQLSPACCLRSLTVGYFHFHCTSCSTALAETVIVGLHIDNCSVLYPTLLPEGTAVFALSLS